MEMRSGGRIMYCGYAYFEYVDKLE